MGDADVVIKYDLVLNENSIRAGAEKAVKEYGKAFSKTIGMGRSKSITDAIDKTLQNQSKTINGTMLKWDNVVKTWGDSFQKMEKDHEKVSSVINRGTKRIRTTYEKVFDAVINVLRATQMKTSTQTKLSSAEKLRTGTMTDFGPGGGIPNMGGGGGAEGSAGGVGASGGVMGALAGIAGTLVVISIAMALIGAFFEAVGPIIKVVMKMLSAMILILLMPFLKRGLPILFELLKWMIVAAKGISGFVDEFLTYIESVVGKALAGDPLAIIELLFGATFGMFGIYVLKKIVGFLTSVDWGAVIDFIVPILVGVFNVLLGVATAFLAAIGGAGGGILKWIADGIIFIWNLFKITGIFKAIQGAIEFIGESVFGKELWEKIKTAIIDVNTMLDNEWTNIINTLKDIGAALEPLAKALQNWKNTPNVWEYYGVGADPNKRISSGGGKFGTGNESINYTDPGLNANVMRGGETIAERDARVAGYVAGGIAQDFISRPGMGIQAFSKNDTLIGVKNSKGLGGTTIINNLNVSAGVDKNEFRKILEEFSRQQGRNLRSTTSYFGGSYA